MYECVCVLACTYVSMCVFSNRPTDLAVHTPTVMLLHSQLALVGTGVVGSAIFIQKHIVYIILLEMVKFGPITGSGG